MFSKRGENNDFQKKRDWFCKIPYTQSSPVRISATVAFGPWEGINIILTGNGGFPDTHHLSRGLASPLDLVALAVATFTGVWYGMLCPLGLGYFFRESGTPSIAQSLDVSSSSDLHRRGGGSEWGAAIPHMRGGLPRQWRGGVGPHIGKEADRVVLLHRGGGKRK